MKLWPFGKPKQHAVSKAPLFPDFGLKAPEKLVPQAVDQPESEAEDCHTFDSQDALAHLSDDPFVSVEPLNQEVAIDWNNLGPDSLDNGYASTPSDGTNTLAAVDTFTVPEIVCQSDLQSNKANSLDLDMFNTLSTSELFNSEETHPLLQNSFCVDEPCEENAYLKEPETLSAFPETCLDTLSEDADMPWLEALPNADFAPDHSALHEVDVFTGVLSSASFSDAETPSFYQEQQSCLAALPLALQADESSEAENAYNDVYSSEQYSAADCTPEPCIAVSPCETLPYSSELATEPYCAVMSQFDQEILNNAENNDNRALDQVDTVELCTNEQPIYEPWTEVVPGFTALEQDDTAPVRVPLYVASQSLASHTFDPYDPYTVQSATAKENPVLTAPGSDANFLDASELPTHGLYQHLVNLQAQCLRHQVQHTANRVNNLVDRYFASNIV